MIQSGSVEAYYENGKQLKDGKGKSKICNLSRHGRDQFQERLDFKFSDFQALEHRRDGNSYVDEMSVCCSDDLDSISDVSDNTFSRTSGSSHWDHLENTYYRRELSTWKVSNASETKLTRSVSSSKDLLGVAQVTIDLLHGEAKTWEENARKLMVDVERLRKHLSKRSENKKRT
ncbi:hypothetical protein JHK87_056958 [Glycine soja]|nr:hypothetical protein JHK87_056958 [Glycine soja]